jgi:predicted dehydrogenase
MTKTWRIGFLGAGGIARAHAYALDALKFYYSDFPTIEKVFVASPTSASREGFASRYGFMEAIPPDAVWDRTDIDALYILGPNHTHTPQLLQAVKMANINRIYVEKPIGSSPQDLLKLEGLAQSDHQKIIMAGFQFLQKSALRNALAQWKSGIFGEPIHFRAEYLHSSYLDLAYRRKNQARFEPIPANGATVDLGSHLLSLLLAFLGNGLVIKTASSSGQFEDVPPHTDLCLTALLEEPVSGAVGTLLASRISQGTGDHLLLELFATLGALRYDTAQPDSYETYLPESGWQRHEIMSDYLPASKFLSDYMPSGWLRALVHNHYLFLGGDPGISFIPSLDHGIRVQQLIQDIADHLHSG